MSNELNHPVYPASVPGQLMMPVLEAMGIPWQWVSMTVVGPDYIEVTYLNRDENGSKHRAGDQAASVTVRARMTWPKAEPTIQAVP